MTAAELSDLLAIAGGVTAVALAVAFVRLKWKRRHDDAYYDALARGDWVEVDRIMRGEIADASRGDE